MKHNKFKNLEGMQPAFLFLKPKFRLLVIYYLSGALQPVALEIKEETQGGKAEVRAN
jgi:hypothetical protein